MPSGKSKYALQNLPQMITRREPAELICDHDKTTRAVNEVGEFEDFLLVELEKHESKVF